MNQNLDTVGTAEELDKSIIPEYLKQKYREAAALDSGIQRVQEATRSMYMANPQADRTTEQDLVKQEIKDYLGIGKGSPPKEVEQVKGYSTTAGLPVFRHIKLGMGTYDAQGNFIPTTDIKKDVTKRVRGGGGMGGLSYKQLREDRAREAHEARMEDREEKKEEQKALLEIPGYVRTPGVRVSPAEAAKLRDIVANQESFVRNLDLMKQYVQEHGSFEFGGTGGAEMRGLYTTMQMNLKNLYDLGAITGPDLSILQQQLADPESADSLFTRDTTRQAQLDQLKSDLSQQVATKLTTSGYNRSSDNQGPKAITPKQPLDSNTQQAIDWVSDPKNRDHPNYQQVLDKLKRTGAL